MTTQSKRCTSPRPKVGLKHPQPHEHNHLHDDDRDIRRRHPPQIVGVLRPARVRAGAACRMFVGTRRGPGSAHSASTSPFNLAAEDVSWLRMAVSQERSRSRNFFEASIAAPVTSGAGPPKVL